MKGQKEMVKKLLEMGMNPNTCDDDGNSPLHYACAMKNFMISDILIHYGANEDAKNNEGYTPWQLGSWMDKCIEVKIILFNN